MPEAIVITPVKDSPKTTAETIRSVCKASGNFEYFVYDDFSNQETRKMLTEAKEKYGFNLIHLEDKTSTPSPNYKIVLQMARQEAIEKGIPLIIIESDVIIRAETIGQLLKLNYQLNSPGLIGAITTDKKGRYNFPYNYEKKKSKEIINTSHSLSFCCTLISLPCLRQFDFGELSNKKDWFDVTISKQAKKMGFRNYLAKSIEVIHQPHSSRPWKNLKYSNPILYYLKKIFNRRDRI